jgi:hypothetical protein
MLGLVPRGTPALAQSARKGLGIWLCAILSFGACDEAANQAPTPPAEVDAISDVFVVHPDPSTLPRLDPRAHLIRLSLDLRGIRPTLAEYKELADSPDPTTTLATLRDRFLASPQFPGRVRDLWSNILRTRVEDFPVSATALGLSAELEPTLFASIGEEPLMLLSHLAESDLPLTNLVTADFTFADPLVASAFPVDFPDNATGWHMVHYTDGRPAAGWLSMNAFWWRYLSDGVSYGRGRANAVARVFLCADFLDRPVDFPRDVDLTDEAGIRDAVKTNDGCIGCHSSLDALASFLAGFQYTNKTATELTRYHPERERLWPRLTGLAPAFYGTPGYSLSDLGRHLASDPRFVTCLAERAFELLIHPHDPTDPGELDALTRHRENLLAGGLTLRALFRSVLDDPRYALATEEKIVSPDVWSDVLFDLTGYRFTVSEVDVFATDRTGLKTLAGGADGRAGSEPSTTPTVTMTLSWERSAEAAASFAAHSAPGSPGRALFAEVAPDHVPTGRPHDDPAMRRQVAHLHARLFGSQLDATASLAQIDEPLTLWERAHQIERDPRRAWAAVLTALLRDPSMVIY